MSIDALRVGHGALGSDIERIDAWFTSWDYAAFGAHADPHAAGGGAGKASAWCAGKRRRCSICAISTAARAPPAISAVSSACPSRSDLIGTPHHDNHAWFSFAVSPFAHERRAGDGGGARRPRRHGRDLALCRSSAAACAGSTATTACSNSLGIFYAVISSTQGGWTWLSSEGRYMGATAYGNNDRKSNPYYAALKDDLRSAAGGPHLYQPRSRQLAARHSA